MRKNEEHNVPGFEVDTQYKQKAKQIKPNQRTAAK